MDKSRVNIVGGFGKGAVLEPFEYDLINTPCEKVMGQSLCCYTSGVQKLFPKDLLLVEMGIEGYLGSPLFDHSGKAVGIIVLLNRRPITNQKIAESIISIFSDRVAAEIQRTQAEVKINQQYDLLNNVFEAIAHPLYLIDVNNYQILMANSATGLGKLSKSSTCYKHSHKKDQPCSGNNTLCPIKEIKRTRRPVIIEHIHYSEDGNQRIIEVHAYPVFNDQGDIIQMIEYNLELTERRRLEDQLRQAQKMEAIGQLAGGVAHDFNNKLGGIIGFAELALGQDDLKVETRQYLEKIIDRCDKSAQLVRQLLAFSRQQILELTAVDINFVISNSIRFLTRVIGEHIELLVDLSSEMKLINDDDGAIDQIITNLCLNARDAMPDSGKLMIKSRTVNLDQAYCDTHQWVIPGQYVQLSVADTGHGMDDKIREQIFEPFFTTKKIGEGTGLGLSMVFGIVKQLKGYIDCESAVGKGTTFNIYFPIEPDLQEKTAVERAAEPEIRTGDETILLVEDDKELLEVMGVILTDFGYQVIRAGNGAEAEEAFTDNSAKIDLVITDVIMPEVSGAELYEQVSKVHPSIKFIFISGYASSTKIKELPRTKNTRYLNKPFKRETIAKLMREVLD